MREEEGRFDDGYVYVTRQGTQIGRDGDRLVVRDAKADERLVAYPARNVEGLNVFGGVDLTTPAIALASEYDITIRYFTRHGQFRGSFVPDRNTLASVLRTQSRLGQRCCRAISTDIVGGAVRNAREFLARKGVRDPGLFAEFDERLDAVTTLNGLRGVEGDATRTYFEALDRTLTDGWSFDGRTRRPPEDDLNALLSLTYVMTTGEARTALRRVGLDPFIGVYHSDREGQPSLALDLLEEFRRPFCDAFTTRLINRGTLTHDDFDASHELTDGAMRTYFGKFEDYMREELTHPRLGRLLSRRIVLREQASHLRKTITDEVESYQPFTSPR